MVFRFLPAEVAEMEARLQPLRNPSPNPVVMEELATKFSASAERIACRVVISPNQVRYWFCNRRYNSREGKAARAGQAQGNFSARRRVRADHKKNAAGSSSAAVQQAGISSGNSPVEGSQIKYEAKSNSDGAWYDVDAPAGFRISESGENEAMVRFSGCGADKTEWVNALTCLRQRSLRLKSTECELVKCRDIVLCYKVSEESCLYFDAFVMARRVQKHYDSRECDCTFMVRYEHDQSEEIVDRWKLCRRP